MNREQLKHLALAGTVTFPATFPRLAELRLESLQRLPQGRPGGPESHLTLLVAKERPSAKVTITRKIDATQVSAVFLPHNVHNVRPDDGYWFLRGEIIDGLSTLLNQCPSVHGIVYVAEHCPTLLEVQAGMTAAESAQYYPPLPCDRSHNHYNPMPGGSLGPAQRAQPAAGAYYPCEPFAEASYYAPCESMAEAACYAPCESMAEAEANFRVQSSGPYWPLPCESMEYWVPQPYPSDDSQDQQP